MMDAKDSLKSRASNDYHATYSASMNQTLNSASKNDKPLRQTFSQTPKRVYRHLGSSEKRALKNGLSQALEQQETILRRAKMMSYAHLADKTEQINYVGAGHIDKPRTTNVTPA